MNDVATAPARQPLSRAEHAESMKAYQDAGVRRATAIGNKGPVRFDEDGNVHPDIVAAYWRHGYYIFEGVVGSEELAELREGCMDMLERAPVRKGADVDAKGRPAFGRDLGRAAYYMTKPLSDPHGGTQDLGGRHPTQMSQPQPDAEAPAEVVLRMYGMCHAIPAALRVYGHPHLLAVAAAVNGQDFVPYNDVIFVKQPGLGPSISWHQDGVTHWDNPDWDEGIHGFNFQVQLFPTTPANALWIEPGSHKKGRADIKRLVAENGGSDQLPEAIPLVCAAGDVTIVNRQMLHGSFANSSPDMRMSITFGFHRRRSVLGQIPALGMKGQDEPMDEARVERRSSVVQVAIDARHQRFPDEPAFTYQPFAGRDDNFRFNDATFDRVIRDYNLFDLAI
jgi:hypothetical protein